MNYEHALKVALLVLLAVVIVKSWAELYKGLREE